MHMAFASPESKKKKVKQLLSWGLSVYNYFQ